MRLSDLGPVDPDARERHPLALSTDSSVPWTSTISRPRSARTSRTPGARSAALPPRRSSRRGPRCITFASTPARTATGCALRACSGSFALYPSLLSSPMVWGEVLRALQRDVKMDPWLRPVKKRAGALARYGVRRRVYSPSQPRRGAEDLALAHRLEVREVLLVLARPARAEPLADDRQVREHGNTAVHACTPGTSSCRGRA